MFHAILPIASAPATPAVAPNSIPNPPPDMTPPSLSSPRALPCTLASNFLNVLEKPSLVTMLFVKSARPILHSRYRSVSPVLPVTVRPALLFVFVVLAQRRQD